ncbi:hypothetical protein OAK89_03320 [Akkermansiaceae bacterium]|nr:hypothetical protein [Akkermansiaceae bacterium]MDB4319551.1 hypothetical protein [bacterium]MDB4307405.1 hypothetical protein [Akkermansiaceae bacterium]MDB4454252.1 hypothetical protein [bacterium]MDB4692027.1 hypothetical protein [Akkermansiaceae bacterium]
MDAVEHAMGKGLPAGTTFGELKHPRTGESNGAFFILFLKDRKFSYYGSAAYERRGLSSKNWSGNLDRESKQAMRNGGRIVDAAKRTIKLIDDSLASRLRSEEQRKLAKIREETALKVALAGWLTGLEKEVDQAAEEHATFRERFSGDGTTPSDAAYLDVPEIRGLLHASSESLKANDVSQSRGLHDVAKDAVEKFYRDKERFQQNGPILEALSGRLKLRSELDASQATSDIESAKGFYSKGSRRYAALLRSAQDAEFRLIEAKNRATAEAERRERSAAKKARDREVGLTTAGGVGATGLGLGIFFGNRGRRKLKVLAEAQLKKRKEEMGTMVDRLFALMDRLSIVVGPADQLDARGYQGETLALSS